MNSPYENLLIKVIDVLANGIGTGLRPLFIRWEARERALADAETLKIGRLAQEQLRRTIADVRAGKVLISDDLKLIEHSLASSSSDEQKIAEVKNRYIEVLRAADLPPHRLIEIEQQINLDQIAVMVMEEAAADADATVDDKPIDPDFFTQWRNRAQDVSNEDMQRLWAKILTGEAKAGGSYNTHTMEFLSRMSRSEAGMIATLGSLVFNESIVFAPTHDADHLMKFFSFGELLNLDDLGIISGVTGIAGHLKRSYDWIEQNDGSRTAIAQCQNKALLFVAKDTGVKGIDIPGYPLTMLGRQLLSLATVEPSMSSCEALAAHCQNKCRKISIGDVAGRIGDQVSFQNLQPVWDEGAEAKSPDRPDK